ncbi:MAG TPA: DUF3489 domain-containing protein [Paludibaculum sp.]
MCRCYVLRKVTTEKDLRKATADWQIARLVGVWNGFAGVAPLGDLKPVKKFTDRTTALKRIWGAMRRMAEHFNESRPAPKAAATGHRGRKASAKATAASQASAATPAAVGSASAPVSATEPIVREHRAGTRTAAVIALLERAGGASLEEIGLASNGQKHTIRGFVSTLSKKGHKVSSVRREDGSRVYAIEE